MHSHFYGGGLPAAMRRRALAPKLVAESHADGTAETMYAMVTGFPFRAVYHEIAPRLAYLDAAGLQAQMLTFPGALGMDVQPVAEVGEVIGGFNQALADTCTAHPGRFYGLGGLPLADIGEARRTLAEARGLGLLGAILPGNYFLDLGVMDTLRPLLAAADEIGAHFMIHPGLCPGQTPPAPFPDNSHYRASAIQLQSSLSQIVTTLILSDVLDAYPNVTFQAINLGGTIPFIFERMAHIAESRTPDLPFPVDRLRRLYFDSASMGPRALELAVKVYGADRIMLGTDFPIFPGDPVAGVLDQADLSAADRAQIAHGTAQAIIQRLV